MAYNICWAHPEVTECWSFRGRLYMSYNKALIEKNKHLKMVAGYIKRWPDSDWATMTPPPIYRVKWEWEEVDG